MRGAWVAAAAAVVALILAGHEWSYHHTHADTGPSLVIAILALTVAALAAVVVWLVRETRRQLGIQSTYRSGLASPCCPSSSIAR